MIHLKKNVIIPPTWQMFQSRVPYGNTAAGLYVQLYNASTATQMS